VPKPIGLVRGGREKKAKRERTSKEGAGVENKRGDREEAWMVLLLVEAVTLCLHLQDSGDREVLACTARLLGMVESLFLV
jgi:hypothetical protein